MSALAGWFSADPRHPGAERAVVSLLRAMPNGRAECQQLWTGEGVALGVARYRWQCHPALEGSVLVAQSDDTIVVSDAGLAGVPDLVAALRAAGASPPAVSDSAAIILRAYECWGADCTRHLRGDYAFVVWDRRRRRVLLARDFVGRRSLFVRTGLFGLAVASSARALARAIEPQARPNLPLVAAAMSGLPGGSTTSAYEGIVPVLAGETLLWSAREGLRRAHMWEPPTFQTHGTGTLEDAALQLREILIKVVEAHMSPGRTAVWLSGGADSPAVFGAGNAALQRNGNSAPLLAISLSYPEGDIGREDEHIQAIVERWQAPVHWIRSDDIPLWDGVKERAALRDDPYAHTFGTVNRAMAEAAAAHGAHVAFDGYGGDALFQASHAYLAELLLAGDLRGWWRGRRASQLTSWRSMLRWGVLPALPEAVWRVGEAVRGRPFYRAGVYEVTPWTTRKTREELLSLGWHTVDLQRRRGERPAAYEVRRGLAGPHFPRALSWTRDHTIGAGVEVRSPLMDPTVIEFAATRPVTERARQGDTKRLLKAAMRGLIPDSVLAPRPRKTGIAAGYLHRAFRGELIPRLTEVFGPGGASALADYRLADPSAVLQAARQYEENESHLTGVALYLTLEAEYWLQAQ